jgi:hypothetical protein
METTGQAEMEGRLVEPLQARAYMLAGAARVTLVSVKTGTRFTYRIAVKDEGRVAFVGALVGADNERDFAFLGTIFDGARFAHGRKSRIGADAPSVKAFAWAWAALSAGRVPETLEIWHEGRCGRCGRALTVPGSIASGIGPECAKKMGGS